MALKGCGCFMSDLEESKIDHRSVWAMIGYFLFSAIFPPSTSDYTKSKNIVWLALGSDIPKCSVC